MASACLTEIGDCLADGGRLDEAANAYEEGIRLDEGGPAEIRRHKEDPARNGADVSEAI
jgi:hypothetical protein